MSNKEEWNEFLNNLLSKAIRVHKESKEYAYTQQRKNQIDELLSTNLTADQKAFVEELMFELCLAAERETEVVYQQGIRDGVWLLKNLEVLA